MSGGIGAHVVIGGVLQLATQVARNSVEHAGDLAEALLHTPEATRAKCSFLSHSVLIINTAFVAYWMDSGPQSSTLAAGTQAKLVCYICRHEIRDQSGTRATAHRPLRCGRASHPPFHHLRAEHGVGADRRGHVHPRIEPNTDAA